MEWLNILSNSAKSKEDKLEAVGYIRDILDYGSETDDASLKIINSLSEQVVKQNDDDIKEVILDAMLEGSKAPFVEKSMNLEPIVGHLTEFNDECLSYILSMLGNSGNNDYRAIIESYKTNLRLEEDVEEALSELDYRIKNNL
ncbi:hypothetical protein HCB21_01955 [Listeria booriae]|uniref:hypothetical protein n=1 Tax=Listeria booriae TaxID=1552123 RepID=UPI0016232916|nr:hypothetical protein [Listeria booriae]MBC1573433.1 hypothetical protein [Listeria booriae]MBC2057071.1 hypothetical protein [Listeria booriae]MBC2158519.1 hypothetical protein [Listeria booriae]MBC2206757.1 hypothetical protein [Listeria booriae]